MKTYVLSFFIIIILLGCGGGSSAEGTASAPSSRLSGELLYGPAQGISYICSSGTSATTNDTGSYTCEVGDNISLYLGSLAISTLATKSGFTNPYELFTNDTLAALNYARLLQAMDSDGNTTYGPIVIDQALALSLPANTDFSSATFQTDIQTALGVTLISLTQTQENLNKAIIDSGGTIPNGAHQPVANAGPDQSSNTLNVTLDASASYDLDGDALSYRWDILSKPLNSTIALSDLHSINPTFTADQLGTYSFSLMVNDGITNSTLDTVQVTVNSGNLAPIANAGSNQNIATGSLVTLDASASSDPNGDALHYTWALTSKPASSTTTLSDTSVVNPSFTADLDGNYELSLIVNDGVLSSTASTVSITAVTGNSAPVAHAGADQNVATNSVVTLNGAGSSDVDNDPLTYTWALISQPATANISLSDSSAVNPFFSVYVEGSYVFELTVNDGSLTSSADSITVLVTTANVAPIANAGADQNVLTLSTVNLDGSSSSDANLDPLSYAWSMQSRPATSNATLSNATLVNPSFTADVDGTYVLQLIVSDGVLYSTADTVNITSTTANAAPVANAGDDATTNVNQAITLDASNSSDANLDPLSYNWSLFSAPAGSTTATFSSTTTINPDFTPDVAGSYVIRLVVNDGSVDSLMDEVVITAVAITQLKKTGQTYAATVGEDGYYQKGITPNYTQNSLTVTDNITGLIWQDDNPTLYNPIKGSEAQSYCSNLSLDGYTDWRLPSVTELLYLSKRNQFAPAIDATIFRTMANFSLFWSSTTIDSSNGRVVDFYYGDEDGQSLNQAYPVRCVRGSSTTALIQRDNVTQEVTDYQTQLIWQDNTMSSSLTWSQAIDYCENLTLNGQIWRAPNINELLSVVDFQNTSKVYINVFENNTDSAWSSTTVVGKESNAFSVLNETSFFFFSNKPHISSDESKTNIFGKQRIKCVRDLP